MTLAAKTGATKRALMILGTTAAMGLLTGCDTWFDLPATYSTSRVEISQEPADQTLATDAVTEGVIAGIAQSYRRTGNGPLTLTVTYDATGGEGGMLAAGRDSARIANALRAHGVQDVHADILPVPGEGSRTLISYPSVQAHAPHDCGAMPGFSGQKTEFGDGVDPNYKPGCGVETLIARQVQRPKDLLGTPTIGDGDAERQGNLVKAYRTGEPGADLDGQNASESQ